MSRTTHTVSDSDVSGYIDRPDYRPHDGFSEITEIHRSERNIVYRARRFGRFWVLKTTASRGCDTALRAALYKEFEVSMMLPRMCAANVYSLEEAEGVGTCIVMDYLEGPTLRRWLDDEPPLTERRRMARSLVEAVGRVHQAGVVHRDIKPENIIVSALGHAPLLIDFGLADTTSHTEFKAPAGTLSYISPEQLGGNRPDIRNDIYSLGCVLRAMRLGNAWAPAIRRCLLPIDDRLPDTDAILRLVDRRRKLRRGLAATGAAAALAAVAVAGALMVPRTPVYDEALRLHAENLERSLDSLTLASDRRIASLSHSLDSVTDSIAGAGRAENARKAMMRAIIAEGERAVDEVWRTTGLRYLDTVNPAGFVANIYSSAPMDAEARRFIASRPDLSPEEALLVTDALNRRIKANLDLWIKRRSMMQPDI